MVGMTGMSVSFVMVVIGVTAGQYFALLLLVHLTVCVVVAVHVVVVVIVCVVVCRHI